MTLYACGITYIHSPAVFSPLRKLQLCKDEVSTEDVCLCIYDAIELTLSCIDIMFGSEIVQTDVHTLSSLSLLLCRFVSCVFPVLPTFLSPHFWASPLL